MEAVVIYTLHKRQQEKKKRRQLSLLLNLLLLRRRDQIRTRHYLTRSCLQSYGSIEWHVLYANGSDDNLTNVISIPRRAFEYLLSHFSRYYIVKSGPLRRGRRPALEHKSTVLGLLLKLILQRVSFSINKTSV